MLLLLVGVWASPSFDRILLAVIVVEIINSALGATIDRVSLEERGLSRIANDLGSVAVLLTSIFPFLVWTVILLDFFEIVNL
jgi:diacylglycerol kinase (ATP)